MGAISRWLVVPVGALLLSGVGALAQARSTAEQRLDLSAFGLLSGTYTGLGSSPFVNGGFEGPQGRNLTLSAGADLGVYTFHGARLGAEVRGAYPVDSGSVDGLKSILGGIRVTHEPSGYGVFGRVRPYLTVLAGRGQITYQNGGYAQPGLRYLSSNSAVYSGGLGFEYDVTQRFSIKADAQFQRWNSPVKDGGVLHVPQFGVGIVYRYGTGRGPR